MPRKNGSLQVNSDFFLAVADDKTIKKRNDLERSCPTWQQKICLLKLTGRFGLRRSVCCSWKL